MRLSSFGAEMAAGGRILVLGTMPGVASLRAQRYYAHERNHFWPIMEAVTGLAPGSPYDERLAALRRAGISLWDVLGSCVRPGSLDADITEAAANDFAALLREHPSIGWIFFNGAAAEALFLRHALPGLGRADLTLRRLPSTSPAHARMDHAAKLAAWRGAFAAAGVAMTSS